MEVIQTVNKHLFSYLPICNNDTNEVDMTSKLVYYYIPYRLRTKLDQAMLTGLPRDFLIPPCNPSEIQQLLAKLCLELEDTNKQFFENLSSNLSINADNARPTFFSVAKEIISDGINWGRIISLFAFAGVLCQHFMVHKQPQMVIEIASILCNFLNEHVLSWVNENGGWNGMSEKMTYKSKFWTNALAIGGIWATTYLILSGR